MQSEPKKLRPEQRTWLKELSASFENHHAIIGQAITSFGKTFTTAKMVKWAVEDGHRCMVTVPTHELIDQTSECYTDMGMEHGIISTGYPLNPEAAIQLVTPRACLSAVRKYGPKFIEPTQAIDDECHNAATATYNQLYEALPSVLYRAGVSGTPIGASGGLGSVFTKMILSPQPQRMLDLGERIVEPYVYSPPVVSRDDELKFKKDKNGEFIARSQEPVLIDKKITIDIVKAYEDIAPGTQALVFTATVKQAHVLCEQFIANGHPAAVLHANMPKFERRQMVSAFRDGLIKVLLNCEIITEGFNVENVQTVIFARKTRSIRLWLQIIGRALRWQPGKTCCYVIDACRNIYDNGHPLADRHWDLIHGSAGASFSSSLKQCQGCFRWTTKTIKVCPNPACNKEFGGKESTFKTGPTGQLHLVGKGELPVESKMDRFNREIKHADSFDIVKEAAERAGYSIGYAKNRWDMKQAAKKGEYFKHMRNLKNKRKRA